MRPTDATYRPDIDGLRAVAVLGVVAFHAFGQPLPGGFVGVDVFFVISGFLITSIIARRAAEGRFSFARFYADRVRRLAPALLTVVGAVMIAAWWLMIHQDYARLSLDAVSSLGFVANLRFWGQAGYFDTASQNNPLLHLWSLGVEEQFYIVWPALLILALRYRAPPTVVAGLIALASFALAYWLSHTDARAAFYSPLARSWELMVGALLALGQPRLARLHGLARHGISIVGLALIGAAMVRFSAATPMPGPRALVPTLGAAMLIAAGSRAFGNRLLALPGGPFIGRISYPLYLWHWPLLTFLHIETFGLPSPAAERLAALAISVALAAATYVWIEIPVQKRQAFRVRELLAAGAGLAAASLVLLACDGVPGRAVDGDARRQFVHSYEDLHVHGLKAAYRFECDFYYGQQHRLRPLIDPACTAPGARQTVLLWGDSHAQALSLGLRTIAPPGVAIAQVASSGCAASLETKAESGMASTCDRSNPYAVEAIRRLRPQTVVIAQRAGHLLTDWEAFSRALKRMGVQRVVLVGPLPQRRYPLPNIVAGRYWPRGADYIPDDLDGDLLATDKTLRRRYASSTNVTYVSIMQTLCNAKGCLARLPGSGVLTAFDYGHLTPQASILVADTVLRSAVFGAETVK